MKTKELICGFLTGGGDRNYALPGRNPVADDGISDYEEKAEKKQQRKSGTPKTKRCSAMD